MFKDNLERRPPRRKFGFLAVIAVCAASATLGSCSQVPNALNPMEWYKSTAKLFTGDDDEVLDDRKTVWRDGQGRLRSARGTLPPGADTNIPNLATVPARPRVSASEERRQVVEGLVADRSHAHYSSEAIQRQGEPLQPLRRDQAVTAARAPAPRDIPSVPVALPPLASPPPLAPSASQTPRATRVKQTRVSALPQTVIIEGTGATVEEIYRARLAQGVPSLATGMAPVNAVFGSSARGIESIVVSSQGVELLSGTAVESTSALAAPPGPFIAPAMPQLSGFSTGFFGVGGFKAATIHFGNGTASLDASDRLVLRDVVAVHRQRGGNLRVIGHASARTRSMDPVRHKAVNLNISLARANEVAQELARQGAPRGAVSVVARSDTEPIFYEVMPSGEAGNRRAEVYIVN